MKSHDIEVIELGKSYGLTDDEIADTLELINASVNYPLDSAKIISAAGLIPSDNEEVRIYQLIQAYQILGAQNFTGTVLSYEGDNHEFLGGLGAAIGAAAKGLAGKVFNRKDKAEGEKGFIGRMVDKIKDRRAEKKAEKERKRQEEEAAAAMAAGAGGAQRAVWEDDDEPSATPKSADATELEKLNKTNTIYKGVAVALAISLLGSLIYIFKG